MKSDSDWMLGWIKEGRACPQGPLGLRLSFVFLSSGRDVNANIITVNGKINTRIIFIYLPYYMDKIWRRMMVTVTLGRVVDCKYTHGPFLGGHFKITSLHS